MKLPTFVMPIIASIAAIMACVILYAMWRGLVASIISIGVCGFILALLGIERMYHYALTHPQSPKTNYTGFVMTVIGAFLVITSCVAGYAVWAGF